jgi:hypothetical protein
MFGKTAMSCKLTLAIAALTLASWATISARPALACGQVINNGLTSYVYTRDCIRGVNDFGVARRGRGPCPYSNTISDCWKQRIDGISGYRALRNAAKGVPWGSGAKH